MLVSLPVREQIGRFKYTEPDQMESRYEAVLAMLDEELAQARAAKEEL